MSEEKARKKTIAKWVGGALAAFLAFAPPGTMILIVLLLWQLVGRNWVLIGGFLLLLIAGGVALVLRRRRSQVGR